MKNFLKMTVLATTMILIPAASVFAAGPVMEVTVPFAFSAGNQHFAPGDYRFTFDDSRVIKVEAKAGGASFLSAQTPVSAPEIGTPGKLVFNQYGEKYFLQKVQRDGNTGFAWTPSRAEKETAKAAQPQVVALFQHH